MAAGTDQERITALERQLERERRYNADLLKQNEELNRALSKFRNECGRDVETQTELPTQVEVPIEGEKDWTIQATSQGASIADSVKAFLTCKSSDIARKDFVYNEALGMYYNVENGMMYDGKRYLYYDYGKNAYLYYDEESGTYKEEEKPKKSTKKPLRTKGRTSGNTENGEELIILSDSDSEEGEVDDPTSSSENSPSIIPCIRMVVFRSGCLSPGDLYIATSDREFTLGRDSKRDMVLSENLVSKYHAAITFLPEKSVYEIQDFGSQNGTFLNGERLSEPKIVSGKMELSHEDLLVIGSTTLVVHIHDNLETCDNCEPGIAREKWKKIDQQEPIIVTTPIRDLHKQQMQELKKKYGLQKDKFVNHLSSGSSAGDYIDRAKVRRIVIGSEHQSHERTADPASVHVHISDENKGFKMLSKMGWNQGEGLNSKRKLDGINEPITIGVRLNETAGLGSEVVGENLSMDDVKSRAKMEKWIKTAKRYEGLPTTSAGTKAPVGSFAGTAVSSRSGNMRWVKGGTIGSDSRERAPPSS